MLSQSRQSASRSLRLVQAAEPECVIGTSEFADGGQDVSWGLLVICLVFIIAGGLIARRMAGSSVSPPKAATWTFIATAVLAGFAINLATSEVQDWWKNRNAVTIDPVGQAVRVGEEFTVSGTATTTGKNELWILQYRSDCVGIVSRTPVAADPSTKRWTFHPVVAGRQDSPGQPSDRNIPYQVSAAIVKKDGGKQLAALVQDSPKDPCMHGVATPPKLVIEAKTQVIPS